MDNINIQEIRNNNQESYELLVPEYIANKSGGLLQKENLRLVGAYLMTKYNARDILAGRADAEVTGIIEAYKYIINYSNGVIESTQLENYGLYFIENYGVEKILSGEVDNYLVELITVQKIVNESVKKNNEEKRVALKTAKEQRRREILKKALVNIGTGIATVAMVSGMIYAGVSTIKRSQEQVETLENALGKEVGEEGYDIIISNTEFKTVVDENGKSKVVQVYKTDDIAGDIVTLANQNPNDINKELQNVYFKMNYDRLKNMDDVLRSLIFKIKDMPTLSNVYEELANCNCFLDYLVVRGYIKEENPSYGDILVAISHYKQNGYSTLTDTEKGLIEIAISEYKNVNMDLDALGVESGGRI